MHFQDIIQTLNRFWADQGCLILQPYDTEKGAGTMSPHTVLRAIAEILSVRYNFIYRAEQPGEPGLRRKNLERFLAAMLDHIRRTAGTPA